MIKDVFVLKKSAWHCKMMKYIWGFEYYDFSHMCPYWWLSVFNFIIIVPFWTICTSFKLLGKALKLFYKVCSKGFRELWKYIEAWEEMQREKWEKEREEWQKNHWAEKAAYYKEHPEELIKPNGSVYDKILDKLRKYHYSEWKDIQEQVSGVVKSIEESEWVKRNAAELAEIAERIKQKKEKFLSMYKGEDAQQLIETDTWEAYMVKMEEQEEARKKQAEYDRKLAIAAARRETKARIVRILKIVKPILTASAYTLGSLAVLAGVYYLLLFFRWCYWGICRIHLPHIHFNWHLIWLWTGCIIGVVAVALLILYIIGSIMKHREDIYYDRMKRRNKRIDKRNKEIEEWSRTYEPINWSKTWVVIAWKFFWKKIIVAPIRGIGGAFQFLGAMFKENCPALKWTDDEGNELT